MSGGDDQQMGGGNGGNNGNPAPLTVTAEMQDDGFVSMNFGGPGGVMLLVHQDGRVYLGLHLSGRYVIFQVNTGGAYEVDETWQPR